MLAAAVLAVVWVSQGSAPDRRGASAPVATLAKESAGGGDDASGEAASAASAAAAENLALFFGKDDRVFVPAPYSGAYAAIGRMETVGGSSCTATLVAPDLAVTAAHCFLMIPRKFDQGKWFWAGYHEGKWQARYEVVTQVFHPRFTKGLDYKGEDLYILPKAAPYDIALMKLKFVDGVPPKPMPMYSGSADKLLARIQSQGSKVMQAGFANDHDDKLTAHQGCTVVALFDNHTLAHQCDTLSGDSGSPLWLETAEGPQLIAVQSTAPDWFNRDKADNTAVTVLQLPKKPK